MRLFIIILFSLTLLTACGPTRDSSKHAQADPEENARVLMQAGDYAAAAIEYLSLADKDKQHAALYRLKAAAAYVEAGQFNQANTILSETKISKGDSLQATRRRILSARLELEFGQPGKALGLLHGISNVGIPQSLRATYHDILAKAWLAHGDYLKAATERLRLVGYLHTPTERTQNNQALWKIFEAIPEADLNDLRLVAPQELISWFELAAYHQSYRFQPNKLKIAIDGWAQRYPGHPAYASVVPQIISRSNQLIERPSKIGLLLPFSGPYEKTSSAIRDGFLAAWYLDKQEKSQIEIYDANALNIIAVYQQAIADGVDYIVGPIEKAAINQLIDREDLAVQVLALNRQDLQNNRQNNSRLIQFGLSPEDEAIQVAETAFADGHSLALVMTPDSPWGLRIAAAFKQRWIELGGGILEHANYESNTKDFATPVKALLNIDSSEQRGQDLRNKLNIKIKNVERRRQDADFIFTAAIPGDARQLFPQFRFQRAADLPVYSTSHIFTGIVDAAKDTDLDGVLFLDMPWILDSTRQLSIIQDALNRNWSQEKSQYRRLYALGIDAYHLIPELGRLGAEKNGYLSGETGDLSLTANNIIKRQLRRAQFVNGKPVLLN